MLAMQHSLFLCISADETIAPKDTKLFVLFTVTMLYSKAEFDTDKQDKYKIAVAKTTGTMAANVEIIKISEENRRASSIKVETKVLASDEAEMNALAKELGTGDMFLKRLNTELKAQGLNEATSFIDPVAREALPLAAIIGGGAAGLFVIVAAALSGIRLCKSKTGSGLEESNTEMSGVAVTGNLGIAADTSPIALRSLEPGRHVQRMETLQYLFEQGLITEAEYTEKKASILDSL